MAQWVNRLVAKPSDLSRIPRLSLSSDLHTCVAAHDVLSQINKCNKDGEDLY